jgi:hypothetical protein
LVAVEPVAGASLESDRPAAGFADAASAGTATIDATANTATDLNKRMLDLSFYVRLRRLIYPTTFSKLQSSQDVVEH